MSYDRSDIFAWSTLAIGEDALDGPFLLPAGGFGLLVSLRGKQGGALFDATELRWGRDIPPAMRAQEIPVFVRRDGGALCLGLARASRRESMARDGFVVAFTFTTPLEQPLFQELTALASTPAPSPPEAAIAALGAASTLADRVAAMNAFVARWHGATSEPTAVPAEPSGVPLALRALHRLGDSETFCVQNQLVRLDALVSESGKLVFYVENQGVSVGAVEADAAHEDPPVYVRFAGEGYAWERETDALSDFLLGLLVYEATLAAPFDASHPELPPRALAKVQKRLGALPLSPWARSGTRFLGGHGVIGFTYPEADAHEIRLGARQASDFDAFEALVEAWPHVGF